MTTDETEICVIGAGFAGLAAARRLAAAGRDVVVPVGRVHWAATEWATTMHGLMEGAVRSGERAADAVLQTLV